MKVVIEKYEDMEQLKNHLENDWIVNLEKCDIKTRRRVIDFLSGFAFLNGSLKKLNKDEYEVTLQI